MCSTGICSQQQPGPIVTHPNFCYFKASVEDVLGREALGPRAAALDALLPAKSEVWQITFMCVWICVNRQQSNAQARVATYSAGKWTSACTSRYTLQQEKVLAGALLQTSAW